MESMDGRKSRPMTPLEKLSVLCVFCGGLGTEFFAFRADDAHVAWNPVAYAALLPIFLTGCGLAVWSARHS